MKRNAMAILMVGLLLAACSGGAPATVESSGGVDLGAGPQSLDLSNPTSFREPTANYEVDMLFTFTATRADGTPVDSEVIVDGVAQVQPPARRFTFTGSGLQDMQDGDMIQVVTIGDVSYFYTAQAGCISMSTPEAGTPFDNMVDTGGLITNEVQRVLPDETVNGIPTYRYALTEENINEDGSEMNVTEVSTGMLYVAKDGGYIVRMVLEGRGTSESFSGDAELEGDISYTLDLNPVASVGEIAIPEGCEAAETSQGEFPVMANATNVASFQGFTSYQSPSDLSTIMEFYKVRMPAAGWTLDNETTMANVGYLSYTLGDRTLTIAITYDQGQGMSNVIIGEE